MKNKANVFYTSPHILASLPKSTPVLLAFSGGADSSALLHLLYNDAKDKGFELHAAHFNHEIRGEEANRDADFCKATCDRLNIPFHLGRANVPLLAKENGNSVEAEARIQRYAFFEEIMHKNGISILVTAHHAEDQVETILLHMLRGSGISGLCGISKCRAMSNGSFLVRPILQAEKEDILSYCKENKIEFVTDSTNSDTAYTRNYIRAEIAPKMKNLQSNLCEVFSRLSENATDANDFIESSARDFLQGLDSNDIPLSSLNKLHPALRTRVVGMAFEKYSNGIQLESTHIKSVIELCQRSEPHSSISLPQKTSAKIENRALVFEQDKKSLYDESFSIPFSEGEISLSNGILINIVRNPKENPSADDIFLDVKCDVINDDACFRSKAEGDVIFTGKMNKKVKKLFNESKIPLNMRKKIPLLACKDEILWIPTVAVCDRIKRDKINSESDIFRITINFEN